MNTTSITPIANKADASRNRNVGGSGLGLPTVKKIVDLHNGQIQVQSELGRGTEITVTLNKSQCESEARSVK